MFLSEVFQALRQLHTEVDVSDMRYIAIETWEWEAASVTFHILHVEFFKEYSRMDGLQCRQHF